MRINSDSMRSVSYCARAPTADAAKCAASEKLCYHIDAGDAATKNGCVGATDGGHELAWPSTSPLAERIGGPRPMRTRRREGCVGVRAG